MCRARLDQPHSIGLASVQHTDHRLLHRSRTSGEAAYGTPDIFNTDQGCQFTSLECTDLFKDNGIQISMDGNVCWRDNVCVERLWKSVKYEEVYRHAYDTVSAAKQGLARDVTFNNQRRPHSALDRKTPELQNIA